MTSILLLFVVGLLLLGFEVIVPGGGLGMIGGLAMLGGCVIAFGELGLTGGGLAVLAAVLLVGLLLYVEFRILPKTAMGRRLFLNSKVTGTTMNARGEDLGGKSGEAVTDLAPTGYIVIEGKRHEAFSRSGFLDAGAKVKVVGMDNFRLIVTSEK